MSIGNAAFTEKFAAEAAAARRMGNEYDADHSGRFPWDTEVTLSQAALGRLGFYIHMHGGFLGSTFQIGGKPPSVSAARGYTIFVRVWLRPQDIAAFEGDAKCTLKAPPVAHVN